MYQYTYLIAIVILSFFTNILFAAHAKGSFYADNMYVTCVHLSINSRLAHYEFSNDKKQVVKLDPIVMYGFELGKRFAIKSPFRLYIPVGVTIGVGNEAFPELIAIQSVNDGVDFVEVVLKRYYYEIGFAPQVQYRIPMVEKKSHLFLSAGGGVHYTIFIEKERLANKYWLINDSYVDEGSAVSMSLDLGAGVDMLLSKTRCLTLFYGFRWWQPINYLASRDLFPVSPVRYKEIFYSHTVGIQFLLRLSTNTR